MHICLVRSDFSATVNGAPDRAIGDWSASSIGKKIAAVAMQCALQSEPGYYPPVQVMIRNTVLTEELTRQFNNLGWQTGAAARAVVQANLGGVFSAIEFSEIQIAALNMPRIRFQATNAAYDLARHYSPDTVRLSCVFSVIQKSARPDGMELFVRKMLWKWLAEKVVALEIHHSRVVSDTISR